MSENDSESVRAETVMLVKRLDEYFSNKKIETYLVGGFVRDILLKRPSADIDIAIKANAQAVAAEVAEAFSGKFVPLDEKNDIARVVLTGDDTPGILDFSSFQGTIRSDLARRDFTIDAMAVKLSGFHPEIARNEIIDPFQGWDDIRNGIIRAVSEKVFALDAVRLLRAVRLAGELGFTIEPETESLLREYGHLVFDVPGERVREELLRLLALPGAGRMLKYLDELDMLTGIFPVLEESRGVEQPKEHYWDVLEHSLATVEAMEFILGEGQWEHVDGKLLEKVPISEIIRQHLAAEVSSGSTRKSLLKLAALLHDAGKPVTKTFDETGRMRFFGHGQEGAELVTGMLEKLRFSVKEIRTIETEITNHMRPMQMSNEGMPSDRAIYRYFRDTGEAGIDILFLNLADHLAARGPKLDMKGWKEHNSLVEYVIRKKEEKENIVNPPRIIDGYDIMKSLGLDAGPRIGELLEAVREAQASGEIEDREEALSFVKKIAENDELPGREER